MKLELGCGKNPTDGYLHTDVRQDINESVDVICYGYELPFKDEVFDEVYCSGVFEHFMLPEAIRALNEWMRVLKPGGLIDFNVPDAYRWAKYLIEACESNMGISRSSGFNLLHILYSLYGWQGHEHDIHKFGWCEPHLLGEISRAGFVNIDVYQRWAYSGEHDAHLCVRATKGG